MFHEVYLGTPATGFEELVQRPYDLFLVCGLDAPWSHDGIREFESQRQWMHERYLRRVRESGSPWLLLEGPLDERLDAASARWSRCWPAASARSARATPTLVWHEAGTKPSPRHGNDQR